MLVKFIVVGIVALVVILVLVVVVDTFALSNTLMISNVDHSLQKLPLYSFFYFFHVAAVVDDVVGGG